MSRNLRKKKRHHMGNLAPLVPQQNMKSLQATNKTGIFQFILSPTNVGDLLFFFVE